MIAIPGNAGLATGGAMALAAVVACIVSVATRRPGWKRVARLCMLASAGGFFVSGLALATALAGADLGLAYVASHTELALSPAFRLAAFWAGQEGSLLLWAVLTSGFAAGAVMCRKAVAGPGEAVTIAVLAG